MRLKDLLKGINVQNEFDDVEVLDVTQDSRLVKEGSLFICIKGAAFDGHSVAKEMLDKGAAAVVVEHDLGIDKQIIVENSRAVYSPICANFFDNPADKLKLIGLTGTNGKTTTTFLIKQILENVGKKVGLIGTVQNMVGDEIYPAKYTTPDPYELQKLFSLMVKAGCEYCVMEVSSQALAQGRVNGLRFALGAFTNLTQDHLDYHKTWENYFNAKRILFENCDIAVTNVDDKNGEATITFAEDSALIYDNQSGNEEMPPLYLELENTTPDNVIINPENVGLELNTENGQFVIHTHTIKAVPAKDATATENGNIAYWYCEGCGKYFRDEALTEEITKEQTVIQATGNPGDNNDTGDAGMLLWSVLLVSGAALLGSTVVLRRKGEQ
mgnify:CR=1 FL=1